jgi:membrane protein
MPFSRELTDFIRQVFLRFREDRCLQLASSLTFTTLLSLVPLLTVMLTIAAAFPAFSGMTGQIDEFIASHVLPEQIGKTVLRYVDQFSQRAGRLTVIGLGFLAATSFLTMLTIERSFNIMWRSTFHRPFLQRVIVYWAILTLGPVLIGASVSMTSYLVTASFGIAKAIPIVGMVGLWLLPFALTIAAFTLLYYIVPSRRIEIRHAFLGGLVAGILFELAKRGFAIYVSRVPTYTMVYGTFATFPIFLLWIYLSWLVTVLGAVVTAALPEYGLPRLRSMPPLGGVLGEALDVLLVLVEEHRRGGRCTTKAIAIRARIAGSRCEQLLVALGFRGWVGRIESGYWTLTCAPEAIRVSEVFRGFVLVPEELAVDAKRPELEELFKRFGADIDIILAMNLADLLGARPCPTYRSQTSV